MNSHLAAGPSERIRAGLSAAFRAMNHDHTHPWDMSGTFLDPEHGYLYRRCSIPGCLDRKVVAENHAMYIPLEPIHSDVLSASWAVQRGRARVWAARVTPPAPRIDHESGYINHYGIHPLALVGGYHNGGEA